MRRAIATVILISLSATAGADIYRSVDAQGHVQYSDTPSPGAELVYSGDVHGAPPSSSSTSSKLPSLAQRSEQISQEISQQAAARAVEQDTANSHTKQCQQARQMYQQAIDARRLFKTGSDGERQYLSDDETAQQRVQYRLAMETACEGVSDQSSGDAQGNNNASRAGSASSSSSSQ